MKFLHNICFIDFETTGTNVFVDEPLEVGAILVDNQLVEITNFFSYIRPPINTTITKSAYTIHNHKIDDLLNAPDQFSVLKNYFDKLGSYYHFAGWNISFDVPFFRKMCYKNNMLNEYDKIDYHHLDVQSIVRYLVYLELLPTNIESLSSCADYFQISRNRKHNALEDAQITLDIFKKIIEKFYPNSK